MAGPVGVGDVDDDEDVMPVTLVDVPEWLEDVLTDEDDDTEDTELRVLLTETEELEVDTLDSM